MKRYHQRIPIIFTIACFLLAGLLSTVSCRKEKMPEPSDLDKNYFVITDNPNDPIDHSIYEFYKKTGLAVFYNDSIYKKKVSREGEIPARYTYIKLSLNYAPLGNSNIYSKPLSSRNNIQPLLKLMEEAVIPRVPSTTLIPSFLLLDSLSDHQIKNIQLSHGLHSIHGFNTVGVKVEKMEAMNSEERKMYAASILAGIALNKISDLNADQLQKEFFSRTRVATKNIVPVDIYSGYLFILVMAPGLEPLPKDIGLLFYPLFDTPIGDYPNMPREADDLRAFLTAAFRYTAQEFADLHPNETLVLQKFNIIRAIVKEAGFRIPD